MSKFMKKLMKKDGFTLVELIVVIAILAILAGVAIPAYSGYIEEANKASDDQLIEAIETAVSAALAMEGRDAAVAGNYFSFVFNETTGELSIEEAAPATVPVDFDDVWENFNEFYGGERDVTLKSYDEYEDIEVYGVAATQYVAPAAPADPNGGSTQG